MTYIANAALVSVFVFGAIYKWTCRCVLDHCLAVLQKKKKKRFAVKKRLTTRHRRKETPCKEKNPDTWII